MNLRQWEFLYLSDASKTYLLPEDSQNIMPKHAGAIINNNMCNKLVLNITYVIYFHGKYNNYIIFSYLFVLDFLVQNDLKFV